MNSTVADNPEETQRQNGVASAFRVRRTGGEAKNETTRRCFASLLMASPGRRLSLGELGTAASATKTILLALFHAAIAREQMVRSQDRLKRGIVDLKSPGDAHLAGSGLPRRTAPRHGDLHVDRPATLRFFQPDQHVVPLVLVDEVVLQRASIDGDVPLAGADAYPRHRRFAPAGS